MPSPFPSALGEAEAFLVANPQVQSFHLIFTDLCGVQRGKHLRREEVIAAYRNGRFMPGSILSLDVTGRDVEDTGLVWEDGDADRIVWPVPDTLKLVPWNDGGTAAQFITTMRELDGSRSIAEPRNVLESVVDRFAELDLTPVAAVELEFYLFDREAALAGKPCPPRAQANEYRLQHYQAYLLSDLDDFAPFFRDLYAACDVQGLPARTLISEYAPGQMEVVLKHRASALQAADEAIMFKRLIRAVADRHGLLASFMAKPYSQFTGCGMHIHTSLADSNGANTFSAPTAEENPMMLNAIAGMMDTMADAMLIFAPNANSYRRFRKASYAPVAPNWAVNNRTVSVRVPAGSGETMHIEHRPAGSDANPYLVLAAVLAGMHHGIVNKLDPGPPVAGNGYEQAARPMPSNWYAATQAVRASAVMKHYFGERMVDVFATIKETEADRFYGEPTELDFAWYLRTV